MTFTLYQRTYPVAGAPVTLSLSPLNTRLKHMFSAGGEVYEAVHSQVRIVGPDDAKVERLKKLVTWDGDEGRVQSTAQEVFDLAQAGSSGFRLAK